MKRKNYIAGLVAGMLLAMTTTGCTGLLMSSDFDTGVYGGPTGNWYWPAYGTGYNGPWYGSGWNSPTPPPPPTVIVQPNAPNHKPNNGANKPNYAPQQPSQNIKPSQPSSSSRPHQSTTTTPTGAERPGNMGRP